MSNHLLKFTFCLFFYCSFVWGQTPAFRWATHFAPVTSSVGSADAVSVVSDSAGNIYCAGIFRGQVDFDPGPGSAIYTASGLDIYVSKLDSSGNHLWTKQIGGPGNRLLATLHRDLKGNLYLIGNFRGVTDFDPSPASYTLAPLTSTCTDMFFMKMDPNGNFLWAKQLEPSPIAEVMGLDIVTDTAGNIYTCGEFIGTKDLDPGPAITTLSSAAPNIPGVFLLKVDHNGGLIWLKKIDAARARKLHADVAGNLHVVGWFRTGDFDPGAGTYSMSTGGNFSEGFILKINTSGNFVWAKHLSGTSNNMIYDFKMDCENNMYINGVYRQSMDADPGSAVTTFTTLPNDETAFILKLDSTADLVWGFPLPEIFPLYLEIDKMQNVYLTGSFFSGADFDPGPSSYTLATVQNTDLFVSRYDSPGTFGWSYGFQNTSNPPAAGIAIEVDAFANVFFGGSFRGTQDFDPFTPVYTLATSPLHSAAYTIKFAQANTYQVNNIAVSSGSSAICSGNTVTLTANYSGEMHWYASATSTLALGSGTTFVTPVLNSTTTYYAAAASCSSVGPRTAITVSVSSCAGIGMQERNGHYISVYPNPNKGDFSIRANGEAELVLISALGQELQRIRLSGASDFNYTITGVTAGVYFLKNERTQEVIHFKIVVGF